MNALAQWLGYALMVIGAVALLCGAVWCVTEIAWVQVKRVRGLKNIFHALKSAPGVTVPGHQTVSPSGIDGGNHG